MTSPPGFATLVGVVAICAGAIASVAGFGIGSILTPLLAMALGTKTAVAAVSVPHLLASAERCWLLRHHIDRCVLWSFGITSAAGGLLGALIHVRVSSAGLAVVFGVLLLVAGIAELTGVIRRVQWGRASAWLAGALSGLFGGLVGNQGGIRTAAMLGFGIPKEAFVATATAIALFVDAARMPVYAAVQWNEMTGASGLIAVASVGVLIGTLGGARVLSRMPQVIFRRAIAGLLIALGIYMLIVRPR